MSVASGILSSVSQAHVGNISETVHNLLSERECSIFDKGLSAYHKHRDVNTFTECLAIVLNTNRKRQLLVPIRETFVKPSDVIKFNTLAIRNGLAMPIGQSGRKDRLLLGAKKIDIKRDAGAEWGFDVRGGSEQGTGVFVSWVEFGSKAHKAGLQIGDQIHKANDVIFNGITHYDATQLFKNSRKLRLWVTSHSQITSVQYATKMFRWVDAHGHPTPPPPELYQPAQIGHHHEADERKVSMVIREGMELGLSIRGGVEHSLGIYVSAVDPGSVADRYGVKIGDQILEANGVTFLKIHHSEAAKVLRANRVVVLKLKDVGKIPCAKLTTAGSSTWQRSHSAPPPSNLTIAHTLPRGKSSERLKADGIIATIPTPTHELGSQVMLTKTSSPAHGIINNRAKTMLSDSEMATFDYYITQYEQGHIVIEDFTVALLQMLNTNNKAQLIAEVRNIIRPHDLDHFNTMTINKEIAARKNMKAGQNPRYSLSVVGESEEEEGLGAISRSSTFATSNNAVQELSPEKMREIRELTRQELEETLRRETEQKFREQFEQEKQQLLMEKTSQIEEELQQKYIVEKEALEKELKLAYDEEKSHLEEKIWQEAEQHIRKELEEEIYRESEKRFHQEYTDRLQQELRKYKEQSEAEKRSRDLEDKNTTDLEMAQMEAEEMEGIQKEEKWQRRQLEVEQRTQQTDAINGERSQLMLSEEGEWPGAKLEAMAGKNHKELEDHQTIEVQQRQESEKAKLKEEIERAREKAERQMYLQMVEEQEQRKAEEQRRKAEREENRRKEEQRLREAERKRREEQRQREQEREEQFRENEERLKLEEEWQQQELERQKKERQRQEEEKRMREEQEKRDEEQKRHRWQQEQRTGTEEQDGPQDPYWGYTGLRGKTMTIKVTKINRKLGLAVDGGSNTRQNGVIIRQITDEGCAGLTGIGLETGQQILAVNGRSLNGLKHKEAVIAIKNAFEGPINKVIEFVVLDPNANDD